MAARCAGSGIETGPAEPHGKGKVGRTDEAAVNSLDAQNLVDCIDCVDMFDLDEQDRIVIRALKVLLVLGVEVVAPDRPAAERWILRSGRHCASLSGGVHHRHHDTARPKVERTLHLGGRADRGADQRTSTMRADRVDAFVGGFGAQAAVLHVEDDPLPSHTGQESRNHRQRNLLPDTNNLLVRLHGIYWGQASEPSQ